MANLTINNKTLDKYFNFLKRLDVSSKKRLISKLTESMEDNKNKPFDLNSIYGFWEDSRDSDTIINEIRKARIDNSGTENF